MEEEVTAKTLAPKRDGDTVAQAGRPQDAVR